MTRKFIYTGFLLIFTLFFLPKFCYKTTGHFWLQTILSERQPDPQWETPAPSSNELKEINALLSQPFSFLGGGMQSFVFLSKDKQVVIKFFKHRPSILKKGRFLWHTPYPNSIFESYRIAYDHFKKETGVMYVHLNKTQGMHPALTLIDKIGIAYRIDLDETEFVLQKRAELICPKLRKLMEKKNIDGAKRLLDSVVSIQRTIYSRGFRNNDKAFRRNVGFVGDRAVLLDSGSLFSDRSMLVRSEAKRDVLQKGLNLEKWLMKNYPQLYDHYLERINVEFGGE